MSGKAKRHRMRRLAAVLRGEWVGGLLARTIIRVFGERASKGWPGRPIPAPPRPGSVPDVRREGGKAPGASRGAGEPEDFLADMPTMSAEVGTRGVNLTCEVFTEALGEALKR